MPRWLKGELNPNMLPRLGGVNDETVAIRAVIDYVKAHPVDVPTLVLFFSDGGVHFFNADEIERLLRDAAPEPIFWQFIGLGIADYGTL